MSLLKFSSTAQAVLFMMVDSSDHITGKIEIVPDVMISKNGGAFETPDGAVTEIGFGWYKLLASAADTDTLGSLIVHASAGDSADPVDVFYEVVGFDPLDGENLGLTKLIALDTGAPIVISSPISISENKITARTGDSWSISISGLGNLALRTKLWFSINEPGWSDEDAKVFIEENDGLTTINGAPYTTPGDGSITVGDEVAGNITLAIDETVTAVLSGASNWAVKMLTSGGDTITLATGPFNIKKPGIEAIQ